MTVTTMDMRMDPERFAARAYDAYGDRSTAGDGVKTGYAGQVNTNPWLAGLS